MYNKVQELIDLLNEKHIYVCHGRRTLELFFMALLSSQTENYHISHVGRKCNLSDGENVIITVSTEYCTKHSTSFDWFRAWKAFIGVPW